MLAYLFPGQGSQERGMGGKLFDYFPKITAQADDVLGYSIKKLCLDDPDNLLNKTSHTQVAIYVVNALSYFYTMEQTSTKPDYVAGHSLGEYNALLAAGVFDFHQGMQLVKKRAELMNQAINGNMAAIIGLKYADITKILEDNSFYNITIANHNSYTQFVISGSSDNMMRVRDIFLTKPAATYIQLKVSGAFHSPYMTQAKNEFTNYLQNFKFLTPTMPVLANIDAQPYHPAITKFNLANQIDQPVKWTQIIEHLLSQSDIELQEIGHGKILTGLVKRIKVGS